jgi:DNA-binding NarL/FixJ family response regulator
MTVRNRLPHSPSKRQLEVFRTYARLGSQRAVATELNISPQTVKNNLYVLYKVLDVNNAIEALNKLGWMNINE